MNIGDKVRVTSGALGGWDNQGCRGRADQTVHRGDEGVVLGAAEWMEDGAQRLSDERGVWFVVQFGDVFIPCVEPDHVEVIA
jgi:hypothetical protein